MSAGGDNNIGGMLLTTEAANPQRSSSLAMQCLLELHCKRQVD